MPLAIGERLFDTLLKEHAVRQVRERVVARKMLEMALGVLAQRHVSVGANQRAIGQRHGAHFEHAAAGQLALMHQRCAGLKLAAVEHDVDVFRHRTEIAALAPADEPCRECLDVY